MCSLVALLALSWVASVQGLEDYLFENQMKLVFCDLVKTQPVYRNEDLAENCVIKVDFFYGKVTQNFFAETLSILIQLPQVQQRSRISFEVYDGLNEGAADILKLSKDLALASRSITLSKAKGPE